MTYLLSLVLATAPTSEVVGLCQLINVELQRGVDIGLVTESERRELYFRCLQQRS